ncbi:hypothetical protein ACFO4L_11465 [Bacillus daqingensis]|uniref:Uncharacterized protein n=1 Tax=Bacillus daqingensis TaxID=872396 RepID=A0ABV9NV66_9BACI
MRMLSYVTFISFFTFGCFNQEDYDAGYFKHAEDIFYGFEYTVEENEIRAQVVIENRSDSEVEVYLTDRRYLSGIGVWKDEELKASEPEDELVEQGDTIRLDPGEREEGSSINYEFDPEKTYTLRSEYMILNMNKIENGTRESIDITEETVEFEFGSD